MRRKAMEARAKHRVREAPSAGPITGIGYSECIDISMR